MLGNSAAYSTRQKLSMQMNESAPRTGKLEVKTGAGHREGIALYITSCTTTFCAFTEGIEHQKKRASLSVSLRLSSLEGGCVSLCYLMTPLSQPSLR